MRNFKEILDDVRSSENLFNLMALAHETHFGVVNAFSESISVEFLVYLSDDILGLDLEVVSSILLPNLSIDRLSHPL